MREVVVGEPAEPTRTKVAVCAATYNRPEGLTRLIRALDALTFRDSPPHVTIVIVDNDPQGGAGPLCAQLAREIRWPLKYVVEPRRGITFARNTALDNARDAEWLGFIDDDEVPAPGWLDELLHAQRQFDADVVSGPVLPRFAKPAPPWICRGRFFELYRYPTGRPLPYAHTNNVLFRARLIAGLGLRFDDRFALIGGEDRHFFERIGMAGYRLVWADDAVVSDWVPESRMTVRWVLQRAFRYGNATALIELDLRPGVKTRVSLLAVGCYRIFKGIFFLPLTWPFGRHLPVTYLRHICYGAGLLAGWLGLQYREYRRTHGA